MILRSREGKRGHPNVGKKGLLLIAKARQKLVPDDSCSLSLMLRFFHCGQSSTGKVMGDYMSTSSIAGRRVPRYFHAMLLSTMNHFAACRRNHPIRSSYHHRYASREPH